MEIFYIKIISCAVGLVCLIVGFKIIWKKLAKQICHRCYKKLRSKNLVRDKEMHSEFYLCKECYSTAQLYKDKQ